MINPQSELDMHKDLCDCRCIHQDRVDSAHDRALPARENEKLAALFKILGDPNRLRILWALEQEEMCVCDLALFLEVSESAVSHQLRQLRQQHLVANRREGPILYYRVSDAHVRPLIELAREHVGAEE